jgi:hypothetical protein
MALHQSEAVRFVRPAEDWEAVLRAGMLMNRAATLLVVRQAGEPVAYMGVQKPVPNREGRLMAPRVSEMAGSRWAIAAALPHAAAHFGASSIEVSTLGADREWLAIARTQGWGLEPAAFPGTIGILDPYGFFVALKVVLAERLGERSRLRIEASPDGVRFTLAPESDPLGPLGLSLVRRSASAMRGGTSTEAYEIAAPGPLAALVFGGDTTEAQAIPPLSGELGRTLMKLFPLPLLWYGYNYV